MESEYIKEDDWFKCTIDDISYDCHMEYGYDKFLEINVLKYNNKSLWFFKWQELEFHHTYFQPCKYGDYIWIDGDMYFKPDLVKNLVKNAIRNWKDIIENDKIEKEKKKGIKILKEI